MSDSRIRRLVIVGGGTAGWMAAASFSHYFARHELAITLVESSEIGIIGVGEATIPAIRDFYRRLGIDEFELMRATRATVKLGIEFKDWSRIGHSFIHPFGLFGVGARELAFHHYFLKLRSFGDRTDLGEYSLAIALARQNRFTRPYANPDSALSVFDWALHFDAALFATYLRTYALQRGVQRIDRKVIDVRLRAEDGFIESLVFAEGETLGGDLFIDCTGFRGLLIEGALKAGYEDWTHWLPCDRAIAIPCVSQGALTPYTRASALEAGWQWRIPLQHRIGNGYVYCSSFLEEDAALAVLSANLEGKPLADPNRIRFTTGLRKKIWHRNCVALGLAAGFLEPLESTSISLIDSGIEKLRQLFPDRTFNPALAEEFNRTSRLEFERIRDFLIFHYRYGAREDSAFWRACRGLPVPEHLEHKLRMFKTRGHLVRYEWETFLDPSWLAMCAGFGFLPETYHPLADHFEVEGLRRTLEGMRQAIREAAQRAPTHAEFIARHCAA
jgi:tryptophan 7-halogenase